MHLAADLCVGLLHLAADCSLVGLLHLAVFGKPELGGGGSGCTPAARMHGIASVSANPAAWLIWTCRTVPQGEWEFELLGSASPVARHSCESMGIAAVAEDAEVVVRRMATDDWATI